MKTMELLNLKQTGIVEDYKNQFDQLVYHIMLYDSSTSETMLVSQFLLGLKEELRQTVEMHLPNSVSQATTLASIQEHLTERSRPQARRVVAAKSNNKSTFTSNKLWKARQLKEYRRANHLCFKCGEKFTPAHKCAGPQGVLNVMEHTTFDGGDFLSNEILEATESPQLCVLEGDCYMSLNVVFGQPRHKTVQLRAIVRNQAMIILIDSGSSHTFVISALVSRLQLHASPILPMNVKVANGAQMLCASEIKKFEWWTQGHTFQVDAKVVNIGAYDLVLGMDWLEQFSPMACDWLAKWLEFTHKGKLIRLQGILPVEPKELHEISVEQLVKWDKGNDLWAAVLLEPSSEQDSLTDQYMSQGIPSVV
jgi:ribosomal protein L32